MTKNLGKIIIKKIKNIGPVFHWEVNKIVPVSFPHRYDILSPQTMENIIPL